VKGCRCYGVLLYADAGVDERVEDEESDNQELECDDEGVDAYRIFHSISEPDGALSYCLAVEAEHQLDWEEIGDEEVVDEDGWIGGSGDEEPQ